MMSYKRLAEIKGYRVEGKIDNIDLKGVFAELIAEIEAREKLSMLQVDMITELTGAIQDMQDLFTGRRKDLPDRSVILKSLFDRIRAMDV